MMLGKRMVVIAMLMAKRWGVYQLKCKIVIFVHLHGNARPHLCPCLVVRVTVAALCTRYACLREEMRNHLGSKLFPSPVPWTPAGAAGGVLGAGRGAAGGVEYQ